MPAKLQAVDQLTRTERDCLRLVAQGLQSKEIAAQTGRAAKTIDKHIENACRKLGVTGRRQAARILAASEALRNGAVEAPIPLFATAGVVPSAGTKGGGDAALGRTPSPDHLGGAGGDLRRSRGDERATGGGPETASLDEGDVGLAFTARSDARDFLHSARSPLRERSRAEHAGDTETRTRLKRLLKIPVLAAIAVAVLAAILGGGIQLQLAIQTLDRMLSGG